MKPHYKFGGLREHPSYAELEDYIRRDPDKIRFPSRKGTAASNLKFIDDSNGAANAMADHADYMQNGGPYPWVP